MRFAIESIGNISSPRAKAFCIKGLYLYNQKNQDPLISRLIDHYAEDLVEKYHASTDKDWHWFEDSLTYSNSVLPEALLYAYKETNKEQFAFVAKQSFDFLLTHVMPANEIKVISNNGWHSKWHETYNKGGEQPIDVAYTILSLILFDEIYPKAGYGQKVEPAFHWFLGQNHLNQLIYDPTSGGCCDGLEQTNVNLNQGAESSICYLLARLGIEKMRDNKKVVFQKIKPANKEIYFIEATETELVETYV
jgi:hypothetical protein